jgi:hypothetical protein
MTTTSPESCAALERRERPERLSILEPDIPALCQPLTAVGAIRIDERHLERRARRARECPRAPAFSAICPMMR